MNEVEAIKDALSIIDVVGRYVDLKKAGINYSGLCPFHHEKTASFYVSPERKTYKCFGCGEGGDIYSFVEKMEGMEFREVLEKFSLETGITLQKSTGNTKSSSKKSISKLQAIMEHAQVFYQKELANNPQAIEYLKKRGFTKQQVLDYKVGYAPNSWNVLKFHLLKQGILEQDIEQAGLIKKGEQGSTYDRFRDRIIFPFRDISGSTIAFSGRYVGSDDVSAKYLNSPATPIFNKSKELYGMDTAKQAMRKNNFAIVVEGQVDVIMGQSVYLNTVATSGTALTTEHVQNIKRFTDRIIFVFDSDEAGINASFKASVIALSLDCEVRIASLEPGKDPADLISESVDTYKEIIKDAHDVFDFWIYLVHHDKKTPREQTKIIEERIIPLLYEHGNPLEQDRYIKHISSQLNLNIEALRTRIKTLAPTHSKITSSESLQNTSSREIVAGAHPLERLSLLHLWQQALGESRWVEVKHMITDRLQEADMVIFTDFVNSHKEEDKEKTFFEFEKIYQSSIMLENDIHELCDRVSTYRTKERQKELAEQHKQALREGREEEARELLQALQSYLQQ